MFLASVWFDFQLDVFWVMARSQTIMLIRVHYDVVVVVVVVIVVVVDALILRGKRRAVVALSCARIRSNAGCV